MNYTENRTIDVIDINAIDVDADTITYSLTGTDASYFNIGTSTGVVTFKVAPDYETKTTYLINIVATDDGIGTLSDTHTLRIDITDITETSDDSDGDYIPDNIETMLGMNSSNSDEDGDGVLDGLQLSGSLGDKYFNKQWHIRSLGGLVSPDSDSQTIINNDLDVIDIYHKYMGYNNADNIIVQVVDSGIDTAHEDLSSNIDLSRSRDSTTASMGSSPETATSTHGTMCAGIIGARAFNGKGVRGVAPFAKIAGSNWLNNPTFIELEEVWTKNDTDNKIAIASNSWGTTSADASTFYEDLMQDSSTNGRKVGGVAYGKLFVKAAGNSRESNHDSALTYTNSNPYVIAVAALKNDLTYSSYSSSGSNIFVSGFAGDYWSNSATIATTNVTGKSGKHKNLTWNETKKCYIRTIDSKCASPTWDDDDSLNYTFGMNGTSAAAPSVAGALALVLEACPTLPWRDVKYLIAKHAIKVDSSNSSWVTNSAGFHHSVDYGFGLINAKDMINDCQGSYTKLTASSTPPAENFININKTIPDNNPTGVSHTFTVTNSKTIEWLGVTVYSDHTYGADLEIHLTSPAGTTTRLMLGNNSGANYNLNAGFRYGSVAFLGESSAGNWTIKIVDKRASDTGDLVHLSFELFGH